MANILVIDDDQLFCETLSDLVSHLGHQTFCAPSLEQGRRAAQERDLDVVFLDVRLPDGNGLEIIPALRACPSAPEVIIATGYGDPDGAELALTHGAWDYLEKTASIEEINLALARALQFRAGRQERQATQPRLVLKRRGLVGESPVLKQCLELVAQAAESEAPVLITGETGTGKEVFATAIHQNSSRAERPLVVVDCASLPQTLAESALFGHERGAFTGADRGRDGLVKQAAAGTLFLDEVGELPEAMQKTFLRVLDTGRFRPLGAAREQQSAFRLIAATNRDLEAMAAQGRFRPDLLFRLKSLHIHLPPLRQRTDDIRDLTTYYLDHIYAQRGGAAKGFTPEFINTLAGYNWPGNVRELINALESAVAAAAKEPILFPWHLPTSIRAHALRQSVGRETAAAGKSPDLPTWREARLNLEVQYLREVMAAAEGNVKQASRISGLSVPRLYELLRKHELGVE